MMKIKRVSVKYFRVGSIEGRKTRRLFRNLREEISKVGGLRKGKKTNIFVSLHINRRGRNRENLL